MKIASKYNPIDIEDKWYSFWMENNFFHSEPDEREAYVNVIPPPNVTGVLHMGHMLNNTIQDILVRRARMLGKNAVWIPGTDHASIATEAKVVDKLQNDGIDKNNLTRDEFMAHAWEWKEKHGGIILDQLKKLGASCDWERTAFTMDEVRSDSVIKVFADLYNKGLIYRGVRMVNWDPQAQTAVSDEEVLHTEEQSKLYYVKYQIVGSSDYLTIATTRPETILGDTAVCVNPNDDRFKHLKDKKVIVPMVNREVPVIFDEYVDMEFGTGCLKITPAHDVNDYEIGIRHNLESIDIFNDDGTLSKEAELFVGEDRFEARNLANKKLEELGILVKIEDYVNKVGRSERTNAVIEPKLSMQWFLKMEDLAKPALNTVMNDEVKLYPTKYKNTYKHWMENIRDWCISRQLWWGHRIPAYYINGTNKVVVAESADEALVKARELTGNQDLQISNLSQDEDVLDTWFSSWLWPISVFDGIMHPENSDFKYYYPSNDLITAPEILFFWVARMIIAGQEYAGEKPFKNVYLHGIVRDKQRRKMSKSLGNSPDPITLIEKYGADGIRIGMLFCSPAGGDLLYDDSLPEQGRNFANKIWNAFRLVKTWEISNDEEQPEAAAHAIEWFNNKFAQTLEQLNKQFDEFRLSEALMTVYRLFWDEFSSWYLELVKPTFGKPIDSKTYKATVQLFEKMVKVLHPFMPFITEEIWQQISERKLGDSIMVEAWPSSLDYDVSKIEAFEYTKEVISNIRTIRKNKNLSFKEPIQLVVGTHKKRYVNLDGVIKKLVNVDSITSNKEVEIQNASSFRVGSDEFFVPLSEESVDKETEIAKLLEELKYTQGFLKSVSKKLENERFVSNAPEKVVEIERKKKADAEDKITLLEQQIEQLSRS